MACTLSVALVAFTASPAGAAVIVQPVPGASALQAVACRSAVHCVAVGDDTVSGSGVVVQVARGRARPAEQVAPKPVPDFPNTFLTSVACEHRGTCFAVGDQAVESLVVSIPRGASPTASVIGTYTLLGVSCTTGVSCVTIGFPNTDAPVQAAAIPLNDGVPGSAAIGSTVGEDPAGIDCVTPAGCVIVGAYYPAFEPPTVVDAGLVTTYANGVLSAPQFPDDVRLAAVSCQMSTSCLAVGSSISGQTGVIVRITNGTAGSPLPVPGTSNLAAIACASQRRCVATGDGSNGDGVFVHLHNGVPRPVRYVPGTQELTGVACPKLGSCVASANSATGTAIVTFR
jgi:hypothetical protein